MCANYNRPDWAEIEAIIADARQGDAWASQEVWPGKEGAIVRRDPDSGQRVASLATYGLIPPWSNDTRIVRSTYNARSETVAEKPSFKAAWRAAQFCLVPMRNYYEPCWESGKAVRWSIARTDAPLFCAAGIWGWWAGRGDEPGRTGFSLLTINADHHPVLRRFHGTEDEKRSIAHIAPSDYDVWLDAGTDLARAMLELPQENLLHTVAAVLPPRARKAPPGGGTGSLFGDG